MSQLPIEEIYKIEDETFFEEEDIRKYKPGGYHPVQLKDVYNGRYRISHKLGHGGRSTVWLAWDDREQKSVSIKIKTASSSITSVQPKLGEVDALEHLQRAPDWGQHPGSQKIVTKFDQFMIRGPNGDHECLVFELLGPTITAILEKGKSIDRYFPAEYLTADQVISISEQLLQAVRFIHGAGISHGDISLNNIAFSWSEMCLLPAKDIFKITNMPSAAKVRRLDGAKLEAGVPRQIIRATKLWHFPRSKLKDIKVIDFGEAYVGNIDSRCLAQPIHLRSPESIILHRVGMRADLWRVGAAIYQMSIGYTMLGEFPDADLIDDMIWLLVKLPPNTSRESPPGWPQIWCDAWNELRRDAAAKGQYQPFERVSEHVLKQDFLERFSSRRSHRQLAALWPVIEGLLRIIPEHRISASTAYLRFERLLSKMGRAT